MAFITPDDSSAPIDVSFGPVSLANTTAIFLVFGATSSLFGPSLISVAHRFHLSLPAAGTVTSVFFVGAFLGVPLGYLGLRIVPGNGALTMLMFVAALGALLASLALNWPEFLVGVFIIGVAFGGMDISLNTLLVRTSSDRRGHRLSMANAGYGVGAVVGPTLIIVVRPDNFPLVFAMVGVAAIVLSVFFRDLVAPAMVVAHRRRSLFTRGRRRSILLTFVTAYILYVAVETSSSAWIAPHLHRTGYSQSVASVVSAGFWGGLALGRMVAGPLAKRWSDRTLVIGGLGAAVAMALASSLHGLAPFSYCALGLIIASIYPMGLIWFTTLCPGDGDGLATLILLMMIGGIIGPALESLTVSLTNIHAVPVVIATLALLDLAVFLSATRFDRPHPGALATRRD